MDNLIGILLIAAIVVGLIQGLTILRAYDFANRDEAAAAAREGRKPSRPAYNWSDESRAAKREPRGA
ncbi:MAG: hypothetical protein ACKOYJ_08260, partial [Planctomycetia bacterium]